MLYFCYAKATFAFRALNIALKRNAKVENCQGKFPFYQKIIHFWNSDVNEAQISPLFSMFARTNFPRLLLGEAPAAAGDEGTPRKLC